MPRFNAPEHHPIQQRGIVGFFDVLGYQSFLDNNDDAAPVQVLRAAAIVPADIIKRMRESVQGVTVIEPIAEALSCLFFSDTVLLTLPCPEEDDEWERWQVFSSAAADVQKRMFKFGFPIRGAVAFGNFFVEGNQFAGVPIVEAYRHGQSLDGAIVALAKSAETHMAGISDRHGGAIGPWERYAVPIKGRDAEPGHVLDFFSDKDWETFVGDDPKQAVAEAFWAHRKDVPPSVYSKITNTEMLIRFLRMKRASSR